MLNTFIHPIAVEEGGRNIDETPVEEENVSGPDIFSVVIVSGQARRCITSVLR